MGIQLGSDFDVIVGLPLDSRLNVADLTARDAIASGVRYEGMIVYVESEEKLYSLTGGLTNDLWVEVGSGAGGGGSGSKNYFDTESSTFEDVTVGGWEAFAPDVDTTPYSETVPSGGVASLIIDRTASFSLTNERIVSLEFDVWQGTGINATDRDLLVTITRTVAPFDTVFTQTILNADMGTAETSLKTYPVNLPDFETTSYDVTLSQINGTTGILQTRLNATSDVIMVVNAIERTAATGLTLSPTQVSGEVLEKTTSLKLTKDAANRNGEFIKLASQTIDLIDRGKTLFGSLGFLPISGYVSGDLIVEVYDVTNSAVLYSGASEDLELLNVTDPITFNYVAYLESTTEEIELRLKVNNANTNTFTITFDEFKFGPASVLPAAIVQEWRQETIPLKGTVSDPSLGSGGSFADICNIRRVGDSLEVNIQKRFGSSGQSGGSGAWYVDPLPGMAVDLTKIGGVSGASNPVVGTGVIAVGGTATEMIVGYDVANNRFFFQHDNGTSLVTVTDAAPTNAGDTSGDQFRAIFSYPIANAQASSTMTTNELGLQTVRARYTASGALAQGTGAGILNFNTKDYDPFNTVTTGASWKFIAPYKAYYRIYAQIVPATAGSNANQDMFLVKNGSIVVQTDVVVTAVGNATSFVSAKLLLQKDDEIDIRSANSQSASTLASSIRNYVEIESGPDLTLIGAVKDFETSTLSRLTSYASTAAPNVWAVPDTAFKQELTPGVWQLSLLGESISIATASWSGNIRCALSSSTTAGASLLTGETPILTVQNASNARGPGNVVFEPITVTDNISVYVHLIARNALSTPTFSSPGFGYNAGAAFPLRFTKLRLK